MLKDVSRAEDFISQGKIHTAHAGWRGEAVLVRETCSWNWREMVFDYNTRRRGMLTEVGRGARLPR